MGKVLVAYATKSGCTAGVAERIAAVLAEAGIEADVEPVGSRPDPSEYEAVVVGSGVRMGSWHGSAKSWVEQNADALRLRPVAFFTACLTMAREPEKVEEVRAYTDALIQDTGVLPFDIGLFAGWFEPKEFGFVERAILRKTGAPEGDHRDWDAIATWARGLVLGLGVE